MPNDCRCINYGPQEDAADEVDARDCPLHTTARVMLDPIPEETLVAVELHFCWECKDSGILGRDARGTALYCECLAGEQMFRLKINEMMENR